ncbi:hypothetical protein KI387_018988, partial [Taxus chinensis]
SLGTCETRMRETRGSADSDETGRRRTNAFWDIWDENARRTRFGRTGRKWNRRPAWTWDIRDEIGRIGRKWNRVHFKLSLRSLRQKVPEYVTRPVRVKLEQSTLLKLGQFGTRKCEVRGSAEIGTEHTFEIGTFGTRKCEVRGSGGSAEIGTSRTKSFGTLGTKSSDGPENGTTSGISADRGTESTF